MIPLAKQFVPAVFLLAILQSSSRADWPHWRGENRDDISQESSGWDQGAWPLEKPLWTKQFGEGSTSPVIAAGRLYTLGHGGGTDTVQCVEAATGKPIWRASYRCPPYGRKATGDQGLFSGVTPTPALDREAGLLFTLSVDGDLHCFRAESGEKAWHLNLYEKYDPPRRPQVGRSGLRDYGYTTGPVVWNDWVIVEVGGEAGNLIAFDKRTGKQVWASQNKDPAGHTGGALPITVEGIPCLAVLTFENLLVARLDGDRAGQTVAQVPWKTDFANNIAGVAVFGNSVLVTSAYNQDAICRFDITLQGARKIWQQPTPSKVCTPVIHQGKVYIAWQELFCLDFATGKLIWKGPRNLGDPGSCIVTADNRILVWADRGTLLLAETAERSPDKCTILSEKNRLARDDAWPHLVLSAGLLFCRDRTGEIQCFDLRGKR